MSDKSNNKRIAKNAAALYFRMIVSMLVGLFTSRVILQALGIEDYGIYNVVGGFVSMFSLISTSISTSISRFLTFELGRGNIEKLRRVFSTSVLVLCGISLIVVTATESVGLWYLYKHMVIPIERLNAAFWVFQISVATFVVNLVNMPYNASIVSHERMDVYAYLSISDAIMKLVICYAIMVSPMDKLIFYAILLFVAGVFNQAVYLWFCKKKFEECSFKWILDKTLFKDIFAFAGWNFIGSSAAILRTQGANLLLNWAGGPVVNAANGIATSISSIVSNFVGNFTQAFNPQITKRYAAGEYESLMQLLIYGSKYSYYLMFVLALPVSLNTEFILKLWLGIVPEHTVWFCRLIFVFLLTESISRPIITAKNATGKIRNYQIVVGGVLLLMLPLSYLGLKIGLPVEWVAASNALTAIMSIGARMYMLRGDFPCWSSRVYLNKVVVNVTIVSVVSFILPLISYISLPEGWINFIVTSGIGFISSCITIFYIGCSKNERYVVTSKLKQVTQTLKVKFSKW